MLGSADSLTDYFKVTYRISFIDYFNEFLYPYFQSKNPGLTKEALIESTSLRSIEPYLRNSPKIVLMDNEDDLILTPEDLAFLKNVFGSRAKIYPYGGHLGNMTYSANVDLHDQRLQELKGLPSYEARSVPHAAHGVLFVAGCGTAPVRKEPEIPAKRPVSEYVKPDATYAIDAYDPWEPMNRRIYNFNAIFDNVRLPAGGPCLRVRAAGVRPEGDHQLLQEPHRGHQPDELAAAVQDRKGRHHLRPDLHQHHGGPGRADRRGHHQ